MKRRTEVEARGVRLWQLSRASGRPWKLLSVLASLALVQRCFLCMARSLSGAFGKTKGNKVPHERLLSYAFDAAVRSTRVLAAQRAEA